MSAILTCGLFNLAMLLLALGYAITILRLPIYHPFFLYLLYHFLGFVVRPFGVYKQDGSFLWTRIGFIPTEEDIFCTTIVSTTALLAVTLGIVLVGGNKAVPRIAPVSLEVRRLQRFFAVLAVLTVLGYYANYRSFGGFGTDQVLAYETQYNANGDQELLGISGYVTALAETLPILCVLLFIVPRLRSLAIPYITFFIAVRLLAGAQRLSFVVVALAIFFIVHINRRLRYPRLVPVVVLVLFALSFDVVGNNRNAFKQILSGETAISDVQQSYIENRGANALTSDIVEFDVATATMAVVNKFQDFSYGSQYLRIFIWPIPRQVWRDKPVDTNIVKLTRYGNFRNLTHTLYADVYMNVGFVLVPVMMFLIGCFYGWAYNMACHTTNAVGYLFYWVILMYTKTLLRDGGVTFLYFWIFSMLTVAVIVWAGQIKLIRHPIFVRSRGRSLAAPTRRALARPQT